VRAGPRVATRYPRPAPRTAPFSPSRS
jgi:hypothetical protein